LYVVRRGHEGTDQEERSVQEVVEECEEEIPIQTSV
jgi:hypothetical protein